MMRSLAIEREGMPAGGATPLLSLRNVGYTYPNGLEAVADVSLEVRRGEIVGLIGPSGCGKSTLLSLVAGLVRATNGSILHERLNLESPETERRDLTLVFQKDTVMPWLTVERNVAFGLKYLRLENAEVRSRVDGLLEMAGLEEFRHAYPRELSGGMRRRVSFLAGVAPHPHILLLDEPFAALDEPTRVGIHAEVLRIVHELEITVVLVTHDLSEAITLCDRIHVFTRRPATVAATRSFELPGRAAVHALRESEAFHELYRDLWHELSVQIQGASSTEGSE